MPRYEDDDYDLERARRSRGAAGGVPMPNVWLVLAGAPVALVLLSLVIGDLLAVILLMCVLAFGVLACLVGYVWFLIVALSDGLGQLFLCLFVPLYNLVYLVGNFAETRRPFFLYVIGLWSMGLCIGAAKIQEVATRKETAKLQKTDPVPREAPRNDLPKVEAPKLPPVPPKLPPKTDPKKDEPVVPGAAQPFEVDPQAKAAGRTLYLTVLTPFAYQTGPWKLGIGAKGEDGKSPIVVQKTEYKYGLSMHPPQTGAGVCRVSFVPGSEFKRFKGRAGVGDYRTDPGGAVVFTVYGNGRKLWESAGVGRAGAAVEFDIDVTGIGVLTLETRMKDGHHRAANAVWLDPWLER